ncbi:hypothetical protein Tco_0099674 [Tanacetum coccineum]
MDIHFVRDMVTAGHVRVLYVPSRFQYADIFTQDCLPHSGHSVPTDVFLDSVSHTIFGDRSSKRPRTDSSGIVSSHMTNWQSPVVDTDGHGSATEHVSKVTVSHTSPGRFHQSVHFSYTDSNTTGATTSVSTDPVSNTVATGKVALPRGRTDKGDTNDTRNAMMEAETP